MRAGGIPQRTSMTINTTVACPPSADVFGALVLPEVFFHSETTGTKVFTRGENFGG